MMRQPTDIVPSSNMEGGVTRASIAGDLMKAMNDIDFKQLVNQYAAMSGQVAGMPMTSKFMQKEKQRVDDEDGKPLTQLQEDIMDSQMSGYSIDNEILADDFVKEQHPYDDIKFKTPVILSPNQPTGMPKTLEQGIETENVALPSLMSNPFVIKI